MPSTSSKVTCLCHFKREHDEEEEEVAAVYDIVYVVLNDELLAFQLYFIFSICLFNFTKVVGVAKAGNK